MPEEGTCWRRTQSPSASGPPGSQHLRRTEKEDADDDELDNQEKDEEKDNSNTLILTNTPFYIMLHMILRAAAGP